MVGFAICISYIKSGAMNTGVYSSALHYIQYDKVTRPRNTSYIRSCRSKRYSIRYQPQSGLTLLIVVNFHNVFYSNIQFFDEEYFPEFCSIYKNNFDVLFVGIQKNDTYRVVSNGLRPGGWFSYHSVRVAWEYIGFDYCDRYIGVLFMNDDSYVDPLNLNDMNTSYSYYETTRNHRENGVWQWWRNKKYEGHSFEEAFNNTIQIINSNPVLRNECGKWMWTSTSHGWSDFFYVSREQIPLFFDYESIMFENKVFLEIAVYNIMKCITKHAINSCNHIGCVLSDYEYLHIHPFKYSRTINRITALQYMTRNFSRYDRVLFVNRHIVTRNG